MIHFYFDLFELFLFFFRFFLLLFFFFPCLPSHLFFSLFFPFYYYFLFCFVLFLSQQLSSPHSPISSFNAPSPPTPLPTPVSLLQFLAVFFQGHINRFKSILINYCSILVYLKYKKGQVFICFVSFYGFIEDENKFLFFCWWVPSPFLFFVFFFFRFLPYNCSE